MRTQVRCKTAASHRLVRTQPGCKTAAFYSRWERSSAVKLQLQAFAALYSWVGELCGETAAEPLAQPGPMRPCPDSADQHGREAKWAGGESTGRGISRKRQTRNIVTVTFATRATLKKEHKAVSDARRKIAARTDASRAAESPSWQDFSVNSQIVGPGARRSQRSAKRVSIDNVAPNRLLTETGAVPSNHGSDYTETMRSGIDGAGEQSHPNTRQHPAAATSMSISIGRIRKGS